MKLNWFEPEKWEELPSTNFPSIIEGRASWDDESRRAHMFASWSPSSGDWYLNIEIWGKFPGYYVEKPKNLEKAIRKIAKRFKINEVNLRRVFIKRVDSLEES
jgi:hypothetical protein